MSTDLKTKGYWTSDPTGSSSLLPLDVVRRLRAQAVALNDEGRFEPSFSESIDESTGVKNKFYKPGVFACEPDGGDFETAPDMITYMSVLLRVLPSLLNESSSALSLSSRSFNAKLAVTKPGGSKYPLHVDNVVGLAGGDSRKLTVILYLNPCYDPEVDGGSLRLFLSSSSDGSSSSSSSSHPTTTTVDLPPDGGRLLAFWSDEIPHEVLPTAPGARADDETKDRYALTLWIPTDNAEAIHNPGSNFRDLRERVFEKRNRRKI